LFGRASSTRSSFTPTASTSSASSRPAASMLSSRRRLTTSASAIPVRRLALAGGLPRVDEHVDRGGGARPPARRLAVPERWRETDRSMDRARRSSGGEAAPSAPEHHSLGEVDLHRQGVARGRPLQADQQRSIPERLSRIRVPLLAAGNDRARSPGAWRALPGSIERYEVARGGRRPPLSRQ